VTDLPGISCCCITYGRPKAMLEESIHAFLKQDYAGPKELLILNDLKEQTFRCHAPEVKIVNVPVRFRSVGEKRNAAVALCRHNLIAPWDDDDIYLPWRLSLSARKISEAGFYKARHCLLWNDGELSGPKQYLLHAGSIFSRELFDKVGGYSHIDSGQDWTLEDKINVETGHKSAADWRPSDGWVIALEQIYYLYRWAGTGSFHLSHEGKDPEYGRNVLRTRTIAAIMTGDIEVGEIWLKPQWSTDYLALARKFVGSLVQTPGPTKALPESTETR
jgi:hypothetical protein